MNVFHHCNRESNGKTLHDMKKNSMRIKLGRCDSPFFRCASVSFQFENDWERTPMCSVSEIMPRNKIEMKNGLQFLRLET